MRKPLLVLLLSSVILSTFAGCGEKSSIKPEETIQASTEYIETTDFKSTDTENNTDLIEQTEWKDSISENKNAGKYTLLFINDNEAVNSQSMKESMKVLTEKIPDQFVFVEVDYKKSKNSLLEYLNTTGFNQLPLAISIAPSGLICGGFDTECTEEELKSTITTGTMEKILLSLQKGDITLITIHNGQNDKISELDKTILNEAEPYGGCVASYYLDRTNEEDTEFISNLPETEGNITVMVTISPGSIVAILTDDEITTESIAESILLASEGGGCGCS